MTGTDRVRLRETFNQAAELYYRARPGYPPALFDELAAVAGLGPGCRVLEIGCGTGQATVPLAERGCEIVAVELGADLATVARRNLARFPRVEVVVAAFEDLPLPTEPFDTGVAATAWHWLAPAVRVAKAAQALRPRPRARHHLHPPHRRRQRGVLCRGASLLRALGPSHPARAAAAHRRAGP